MITRRIAAGLVVNQENLLKWLRHSLEVLWLFTVVAVPLAFFTQGELRSAAAIAYLEVPKVALLRTLVALMAGLWLLEWMVQRWSAPYLLPGRPALSLRLRWRAIWQTGEFGNNPSRWVILSVSIFLFSVLLSTALSGSFSVSMWGQVPGEDGYATYTVLAYLFLFAVIAAHLRSNAQMWRLFGAIATVGTLVAAYAIFQHYGNDFLNLTDPTNTTRSTAMMGNPILSAAFLLMTILISLVAAAGNLTQSFMDRLFWGKICLWSLALSVQMLGIIFTESRGPWLGMLSALLGLLSMTLAFIGPRVFLRVGLVLAIAAILSAAALYIPSRLDRDANSVPQPAALQETTASPGNKSQAAAIGSASPPEEPSLTVSSAVSSSADSPGLADVVSQRFTGRGAAGRPEIWRDSWRLMVHRPWFVHDNLSLSFLRPLIGYGPELFRYTYMLESMPQGENTEPREPAHAHNYFIHQGVELGFLGMAGSLGIHAVPWLVGSYLLLRRRRNYSDLHKLALIGLMSLVAGRFVEQLAGLARISDLTIFWVLLGTFSALLVLMSREHQNTESPDRGDPLHPGFPPVADARQGKYAWARVYRLTLVGCLIGVIVAFTWVKTINYPRAAVLAASGEEQAQSGQLARAQATLRQAINLAPDVWINYNRLAAVYSSGRSNADQELTLDCGGGSGSASLDGCLGGKAYMAQLDGAEQRPLNFRSVHALASSAVELAIIRGTEEARANAIRHYKHVVSLVPNASSLHVQLAATYLEAGKPGEALRSLEESLALLGDHTDALATLVIRGIAYRNLGQPLNALKDFDKVISVNPASYGGYMNRAIVQWSLGSREEAIQDLTQAISFLIQKGSLPDYTAILVEAYNNRGLMNFGLERPNSAIEDLQEAIRIDPLYSAAHNNLGLVYAGQGRRLQAISSYDEAIEQNPQYVQAYINRGLEYRRLRQLEKALSDSSEAIGLDPERASAYALRATVYTLLGRQAEARRDRDQAAALGFNPDSLPE